MEEDAPAQGGKQASRPSKETAVMFRVPEEDGGLPGQQNASPGLKEVGIWSLTIHGDGRDAVGQHVKAEQIFNFVTHYAQRKLWDFTSHMLVPNQKPFDFKPDQRVYTFTAGNEHYIFVRPDYIHVSFMQPAQVYVFLLSMTKVPQWLRNDFEPARTPGMAITWQLAFHGKVLAILSQKMASIKSSRLRCWVRKEHCVPGVQYTLGSTEGNQPLEDFTYMLAWRLLDEGEEVNTGGKSVVTPLVREEEDMEDELKQLHNMVQAVDGDDYGLLVSSCETYNRIVTTAAKRAALAQGLPADFDVRRPPKRPSFLTSGGRPLTTVAALANAQPRLLLYLISQGAEIDATGFKYVLANSKQLPSGGYCSVQHLVLSYLAQQRNPISCALVFAQVLEDSATSNSAKAKEWRELSCKLRSLATDLVGHLDKLDLAEEEDEEGEGAGGGGGGGTGGGGKKGSKGSTGPALPSDPNAPTMPAAISDVVAPRGVACSINDASPLMVAYDTNDLEFMSAPVVQGYLQQRWLGPDYILLALQEKGSTFHYQDHHLLLHVLEGSGFVGSLGKPVMKLFSYMMHALVFASRAFFDSPRGRWIFKMMLEAFFLYTFHSIQLMTDETAFVWQHVVLLLYVCGMLVDEVQEGAHQYHGRIAMYFQSGFNIVEAICWLLLVASIGLKIAMWTVPDGQDNPLYPHLATAKHFLYNTASIFVWSRLLQYIIPLYDGMGSQLMVISQMIREVLKFAVPGIILMTGVCFTLYSMFRFRGIDKFDSFPMVMLMLFRTFLGETMFEIMEEENTTEYNLYGNIIVLLYALTATVVLANLLIALISYRFQPEKIEGQSKFQMAEILAHYEYMVEHHLVGAPFSLPQLLVSNLLPSGARQKGSSSKMVESTSLPPMDGLSGTNMDDKFYPTGSNEVPYLIFLLTLYPTTLGLAWALYFGMAPYSIFYFTFIGYKKWTGQSSDKNSGSIAGGSGSAKVAPKPSAGRTPNGNDDGAAAADEPQGPGSGTGTDMLELSGGHGGGGGPSLPYGFEEWDTSQRMASLARLALRTLVYMCTRPLWFLGGCVGYLLLGSLLVLVWLGVYTWVGKLIFHTYWVVRGWLQGWFGATNVVLAKKDGPTAASTLEATNTARTLERAQDRTWVRVQQAHLKNGGQVITREELLASLKKAGFKGLDRRLALAGAIPQSDAIALLRRRKSVNGKALAAAAADLAAAAAGASPGAPDREHDVAGSAVPWWRGKAKHGVVHGLAGGEEGQQRSAANLEHSNGEEEDGEGEGTSSSDSSSDDEGHGAGRGGSGVAKQRLGAANGGGGAHAHAHAVPRQAGPGPYGDPGMWDPKALYRAVRKVARGLEQLKHTVAGLTQGLQEAGVHGAGHAAGAGTGASVLSLPPSPPPPLPPAGPPASLSIGRRPSNSSGSGGPVQRRESGGLGPL